MQAMQSSGHGARTARLSGRRGSVSIQVPGPIAYPLQAPAPLCSTSACSTSYVGASINRSSGVCYSTKSKLDNVGLFADPSLLGGVPVEEDSKGKAKIDDVPLESELMMDYAPLRDHLKAQDFRKADDETRALLIRLAGEGAIKRGWVYFTEAKMFPVKDLQTIDALWRAASNGRFGYSVQREIFNQAQRRWPKFFKTIDWVVGDNNVYRKWPMEFNYTADAVRGHLPLTNALRGTQLFEALLTHPAWEKLASSGKKSIDEKAKEAGANTLKF